MLRHGREGEVKEKRRTNQRAEGQGEGIGAVLRHGREGEKLNQCEICIMGKGISRCAAPWERGRGEISIKS